METVEFYDYDTKETVCFTVVERTVFGGEEFLLVTDPASEEEEETAYILRVLTDDDEDYTYQMVDDDELLSVLGGIFQELLEDTEIH